MSHLSNPAVPQPPARGVYWARHRKNNRLIAYAVDSKGNEVRRLVLRDEAQWRCDAAVDYLWRYLDVVDPEAAKPKLELVRSTPVLRTERAPSAEFDPYNLPPLPWRPRV